MKSKKKAPSVHKTEWWTNANSKPPVIFAGEISNCGLNWVVGSRKWKFVTCRRCKKTRKKAE